ncbi:hypothetical protein [Streptomyces sp. NBC_00872]|uniref:hypothetical protein n=1 Tax=Streptomyces sp. NBC_00872 TaxID=2903686 RepID=UPI00386ED948|nr:hypothetical protein OG214_14030 [Streptomyces sp. NBC_00872]
MTAKPPTSPPPDFARASVHHYRSAVLATGARWQISADHLAGLAAECGIKAILISFLGSELKPNGMPHHPEMKFPHHQKKQKNWDGQHGHLPALWEQLTAVAHRRNDTAAGLLFSQLLWENPFADWDVGDRYCDGTMLTKEHVDRHLKAAHDLIAAHEQARILGTGTLV